MSQRRDRAVDSNHAWENRVRGRERGCFVTAVFPHSFGSASGASRGEKRMGLGNGGSVFRSIVLLPIFRSLVPQSLEEE